MNISTVMPQVLLSSGQPWCTADKKHLDGVTFQSTPSQFLQMQRSGIPTLFGQDPKLALKKQQQHSWMCQQHSVDEDV